MDTLPKRFINNVKVTPKGVNLQSRFIRPHFDDLAATLKMIKATEHVELNLQEAEALFGKTYKANIVRGMKTRGIKRTKCVTIDKTVYISSCEI